MRDLTTQATRRRFRTPEVAGGVLVVVLFALAGLVWHLRSVDRTPALAVAGDVARGAVIEADDLRTVYVTDGDAVARLDPVQVDDVVGRTAAVNLSAGTLVTSDLVVDVGTVGAQDGVVGLALEPGQYPANQLAPGDRVDVVVSPSGSTTVASDAVIVRAAQVYAVETLADGERKLVSLRASAPEADAIATVDPSALRLVWMAGS